MKKIFLLLFLLISYSFSQTNDTEKANKKLLFLGNANYEPYLYISDNQQTGIVYDLVKEILKEANINAEIKLMDWALAQQMIKDGKADALLQINKTVERQNYLDFSDALLDSKFVVFKNKSRKDLYDFNSLNGKTIGVEKKSYAFEILTEYPEIKIHIIKSWKEGFELINENKIDAVVTEKLIGQYTLNEYNMKNIDNASISLDTTYSHIAVKKGNEKLLKQINIGLENITKKGIREKINKKWNFENINKNLILSKKEKDYLKLKNSFNVCTRFNHFPLSGEKNGVITGISGDIFKRISEELNVSFKAIGAQSDKEFINNVESNKCELVTTLNQSYKGFKNIVTTNVPILEENFVAIGNVRHIYMESLENDSKSTFYVLKKIHKDILEKEYKNLNIQILDTENKIIDRISKNNDSYYITLRNLADYTIYKYGYDKYKIVKIFEDYTIKGAIGVNNELAPNILTILDKVLTKIGEEELKNIVNQFKHRELILEIHDYIWLWYLIVILALILIGILFRYFYILKKINEDEKIYKEILDNSNSKIAFINKDYLYLKVNNNYALMINKQKSEIENNYMEDVLDVEYFRKNLKPRIDLALNGELVEFEVKFKDRYILANYTPYFDEKSKKVSGVIFNLVDITEKKESAMKEKELVDRLVRAQKIGKLGAWKYNVSDNTLVLTGAIAKYHDVEVLKPVSPEVVFRNAHEQDMPLIQNAIENTLKDKDFKKELIYRMIDKEENLIRYLEVKWEHVLDEQGNILGLDGVGQDITESVLAKQKDKEQQELLMHSQKLAQQGEMLQMIGHQWRQPLAQISLNAQIIEILLPEPNDEISEKIESIIDVTEYLSKTIADFKNFFTDKKKMVDFKIKDIFDESLNVIKHRIEQQSINVKEKFVGVDEEIKGHKTELGQVILSIVNNAIDILEEKKIPRDIYIDCSKENEKIIIRIKDNGGGIPENIINNIFEPYFSTKLEKNGTGLGLYMAKMIIEKSFDGTIKAINEDEGACFVIEIPII